MQEDHDEIIPNLDFEGHNTLYATHGLHAYAAKCPPQLVRYGIEHFTKVGETILDPMAGSGTVMVEARLLGRNAIGCDIDPLSCLLSQVKSREVEDCILEDAFESVLSSVLEDLKTIKSGNNNGALQERLNPPEFNNRDYWFSLKTREQLAILSHHIYSNAMDERARDFLWVVFSSIILSKVSVANARDIIHSRHHFYSHTNPPDPIKKFEQRFGLMRKQMRDYWSRCQQTPNSLIQVCQGDARNLALKDETVDLIFTSPPYATALDYLRAHFLAVAWMQKTLGISLSDYLSRGATYIGSERGEKLSKFEIDPNLSEFSLVNSVVDQLLELDGRKAFLIHRYFRDMYLAIKEMARVIKSGRQVIIVVCPSHIRKIEVPTHHIFSEFGSATGLELMGEYTRTISARRRVLPYVRESFGNRMSTEYVLIFKKNGR